MLTKKELKMCRMLLSGYKKKLKKYVSSNTKLSADDIVKAYEERFYRYMNEADMGSERGRFVSYLNIFSGLAAYEILREKGLTEAEGVKAYDSMCAFMRKVSSILYKGTDLLPNGYKIVRQSLLDDLEGEKESAGIPRFCRMMIKDLPMRSIDACILTPAKNMAIRSSARCFAPMIGTQSGY